MTSVRPPADTSRGPFADSDLLHSLLSGKEPGGQDFGVAPSPILVSKSLTPSVAMMRVMRRASADTNAAPVPIHTITGEPGQNWSMNSCSSGATSARTAAADRNVWMPVRTAVFHGYETCVGSVGLISVILLVYQPSLLATVSHFEGVHRVHGAGVSAHGIGAVIGVRNSVLHRSSIIPKEACGLFCGWSCYDCG